MPTLKLTETRIEALKAPDPSGRQVIHWDTETRGLGVLCSGITSAKSFLVQHKLTDRRTRRVTVGPVAIGLKKARADAAALIAGMLNGVDPKADRRATAKRARTLGDALESYLADNLQIGERSREGYRSAIENYLNAWLKTALREIGAEAVLKRHRAIAAEVARRNEGSRRGGGPTKGHATADGVMRALRAVYYHAAALDPTLPPNPVRLKKSWFKVQARTTTVPRERLPDFYQAISTLPSRVQCDYLMLLTFTGMRRGEAAALTWEEVDLREWLIRLPPPRTKTRRALNVPMTDVVHDLLVARRAIGREGPFVFTADSASGHIEEPKFAFEQVAKACGVEVTAHDLRRLYITVANSVVSGRDSRALTNHSVGGNTHDNYDQVSAEELREPAQRVADRLKELCGIGTPPEGVAKIG